MDEIVYKVFEEAKSSLELENVIDTIMNTSEKFMVVHTSRNINIGIENVDDGDRLLEFRFDSHPLQYFVSWEDLESWTEYCCHESLKPEKVVEYLTEHVRYLFDNCDEYFYDADDIVFDFKFKKMLT